MDTKRCCKCGETKAAADFHKCTSRADGFRSDCKSCNIADCRAWKKANADKERERLRAWAKANADKERERKRAWRRANLDRYKMVELRRAGIAEQDLARAATETLAATHCSICGTDKPGGRGGWNADHYHTSGRFRAPLCANCNRALGLAKDNPATLRAMADYLEAHAAGIITKEGTR